MSQMHPLLTISGARKAFGGVQALAGADLTLYPNEIHALLGENGAGKSTLLKALAGVHRLDAGEIRINDSEFIQGSTKASQEQGITVIYQEPSLFPDLTLAENVFIGRQLRSGRFVDWKSMNQAAKALFDQLGVPLNPNQRARGLSIADQQIVEIAKALSSQSRVIVMDEPTAALSAAEVSRLFDVARRLRDQGAAVVFVSHRLEEVFELCDRMTVMRDGATVSTSLVRETTIGEVVRAMVGRELTEMFPKVAANFGEVVLEVKNLTRDGQFENISFSVRAGEIVALAGLVGSGRSEVVRAIFGIDPYESGAISLEGSILPKARPEISMDRGIALVPEDRRLQGLFMPTAIKQNAAITMLGKLRKGLFLVAKRETEMASRWAKTLQLKFADLNDPVERLSGGNQQKVVLAKWLATEPKLLIVDEPTRGIDVGTKAEVHRLLSEQAAQGLAVLMISSELPEVLGMADRVIVMREGLAVAEFSREHADQEKIMLAATGAAK